MNRYAPRRAGILLAAAAFVAAGCTTSTGTGEETSTDAETVVGITWEWTETRTPRGIVEVSAPDHYTFRLKRNGEAQIRYDCNHGGSLYEISEGSLSFGTLTYTRIKCGEASRSISYRQQLGAVTAFFTQQGSLYLELLNDTGTMRFRRAGDN